MMSFESIGYVKIWIFNSLQSVFVDQFVPELVDSVINIIDIALINGYLIFFDQSHRWDQDHDFWVQWD